MFARYGRGMTRLLRIAEVAVLVGGATAVLTSCSGDPGPIVTETPSPASTVVTTPSPSPTPSVTPEEELLAQIPENARNESFVAATNFAKFYLELYPQMMTTLDGELFQLLSSPGCEFCQSALQTRDDLEDASQVRQGGEPTFPDEPASGGQEAEGTFTIVLKMETAPSTTVDATGDVVGTGAGGVGVVGLSLSFDDGHWTVLGVNLERAG